MLSDLARMVMSELELRSCAPYRSLRATIAARFGGKRALCAGQRTNTD